MEGYEIVSYISFSTKMEKLSLGLIYEIARYAPQILAAIEITNSNLKYRITHDAAYIQTLVEEMYNPYGVRQMTYDECKGYLMPPALVH